MVQNTHLQVIGGANLSYALFSHVNDYTQDVFINTLLLYLIIFDHIFRKTFRIDIESY